MIVTLPDDITEAVQLPEAERNSRILTELACALYAGDRLSCGKAAELAGLTRFAFGLELAKRNIPRHYDDHDLRADTAKVLTPIP